MMPQVTAALMAALSSAISHASVIFFYPFLSAVAMAGATFSTLRPMV